MKVGFFAKKSKFEARGLLGISQKRMVPVGHFAKFDIFFSFFSSVGLKPWISCVDNFVLVG